MRRLLVLSLMAVMLVSLVGCVAAQPETENISPEIVPGQSSTDYTGMEIRVESFDYHKDTGTFLTVLWDNQTQYEVFYGEVFTIERLDGKEWVSCSISEDLVFDLLAYQLKAGKTATKTYYLTNIFDVSSPGTYRIKTNCEIGVSDKYRKCHLTAEFAVVNMDDLEHTHQVPAETQTTADPVAGYCGNTLTTLHIGEKTYSFMFGYSVTLTDILENLHYDPKRICNCLPEFTVDTEFGTGYGINLTEGYARCAKGQVDLTREQIDTIAAIVNWAETTNCQYPVNG